MRKILVACSFLLAVGAPQMAMADDAAAGAATGAAVGGVTGAVVGGPVGAAVGAGVGGTVGAAAGDHDRNRVIVAPAATERSCVTDAYGNRTCTSVTR